MYKKLFVLFIALILVASLTYLFVYDKKELEKEAANNQVIENEEKITYNTSLEYEETDEEIEEKTEEKTDEIIGTLIIQKIDLIGKVKDGVTEEILENYIGHVEETPKFNGNVGLAAHNRGNQYPYFARINELELGDEIIYKTEFGERTYTVNNIQEILDTDWSLLQETQENTLTLITCIANRVNQRLCVQAVQKNA